MKILRSILLSSLLLLLPCAALVTGGCTTPPAVQNVEVQTLKTVGQTAEATVAVSAQLYASGKISAAQAKAVLAFYDGRFQPAFRLAVAAAKADLSTVASPDLVNLSLQLASLLQTYTAP